MQPLFRTPLIRAIAIPLLLATVAGCTASRETRIATALAEAGLRPDLARCMATPIARDLDSTQLRALQRVARLASERAKDMTGGQMLDTLQRSNLDPKTVAVVASASVSCFLRP